MRLTRLAGQFFRNLAPFSLDTDASFVVFTGDNGHGKTNVLEAIWWLATLRPLRGHRTRDLIAHGQGALTVAGGLRASLGQRELKVGLDGSKRALWLDGARCNELDAYFADIRAIAFQPSDGEIVTGEPSRRRAFLDRAAFTATPAHLGIVRAYQRVLAQKAAALKEPATDRVVLDVLDEQLADLGARLVTRRRALLDDLQPHAARLHGLLADGASELALTYQTRAEGETHDARRDALARRLHAARRDELRRRITLEGPHTDDLVVTLNGAATRTFGSRGQVRSVVLALKLAEMHASRARGVVPIFLLDDVSSELDRARTRRLIGLLAELEAQVFASTTDPSHIEGLPAAQTARVAVQQGVLAVI